MLPVYPHVGLIIGYSGWGVHRFIDIPCTGHLDSPATGVSG
jgi:hypothetical protein